MKNYWLLEFLLLLKTVSRVRGGVKWIGFCVSKKRREATGVKWNRKELRFMRAFERGSSQGHVFYLMNITPTRPPIHSFSHSFTHSCTGLQMAELSIFIARFSHRPRNVHAGTQTKPRTLIRSVSKQRESNQDLEQRTGASRKNKSRIRSRTVNRSISKVQESNQVSNNEPECLETTIESNQTSNNVPERLETWLTATPKADVKCTMYGPVWAEGGKCTGQETVEKSDRSTSSQEEEDAKRRWSRGWSMIWIRRWRIEDK